MVPILLSLCLVASPALAGSQESPEVSDEEGDVDVQHLVEADVLDEADVSEAQLETSADIVRAWIDKETQDGFEIKVELADIPEEDELEVDGTPIVDVWAHATIREGDYHASASLSSPEYGGPTQADFDLYLGDAKTSALMGSLDAGKDIVSFHIPKPDVRDPAKGDELTRFYVTTHAPEAQAALDYAPGTNRESLPGIAEASADDPTSLELAPDARFGDPYPFQVAEEGTSRISVDVTPGSLEIPAGEQETFHVRVTNDADGSDDVSLSLSNTPSGWSANIQPNTLSIPAHSSETAELHITPAQTAEGHEIVSVHLSSERGANKGASVSVVAVQPDDGGVEKPASSPSSGASNGEDAGSGGEEPEATDDEEAASQEDEETEDAPGPSLVVGLAAIALAALVLRRRC